MRSLLLHWAFNAVALWVAAYFITGLDFHRRPAPPARWWRRCSGSSTACSGPLLTVLTCPLIVITLGLFTLVINALMLMRDRMALGELGPRASRSPGFWPAFWGGLVVGTGEPGAVAVFLQSHAGRSEQPTAGVTPRYNIVPPPAGAVHCRS